MSDLSGILLQIDSGDPSAAERLLPLVYDELRKLAAVRLAKERPGQTLQATALVHEAYLRLVGAPGVGSRGSGVGSRASGVRSRESDVGETVAAAEPTSDPERLPPAFDSRGHFFAAAAEAMRRILVENARQKASLKRGGQMQRLPLGDMATDAADNPAELLALDEALLRLAEADPQAAQIVKLRYFAGLSMDEAAQTLGISPRTAYYAWEYARSWLKQELHGGESRG